MAFQLAKTSDSAGVGYGILLYRFKPKYCQLFDGPLERHDQVIFNTSTTVSNHPHLAIYRAARASKVAPLS
jgi:hypothetical protein